MFKSIPKSGRVNVGKGGIEGRDGNVTLGKTNGISKLQRDIIQP